MIAPAPIPASAASVQGPVLRDIHLPPDPSFWPPALGWWLLVALLLGGLLVAAWCWRRHRRTVRRRQRVMDELDLALTQYRHDGDTAALAARVQELLRRVARQHVPSAARQRGEAWRQTLARMPLESAAVDALLALDRHIYQPGPFDHTATENAARAWLRLALRHRHWKRSGRAMADPAMESAHV